MSSDKKTKIYHSNIHRDTGNHCSFCGDKYYSALEKINHEYECRVCTCCRRALPEDESHCTKSEIWMVNQRNYGNLKAYYQSLGIPWFLFDHIQQKSDYKYRIGNWVFAPSPSWYSDDIEGEIQALGVRFIAWWIHPKMDQFGFWNDKQRVVDVGGLMDYSHYRKPEGYLDSVFDLRKEHVSELFKLRENVEGVLGDLGGHGPVDWFVHMPVAPMFSTLHVNFASKKYLDAVRFRTPVRPQFSVDEIIAQIEKNNELELQFRSCTDTVLWNVHNTTDIDRMLKVITPEANLHL
eukprot:TRINITY_DN2474_c0_g1_i9.p1 TRINITY_DN2474_c0_g1~~TRINITY_DN2474_c0_g1_i9.p1  ORF type:complete len:293 (-),score=44.24 TRINITY_DN2474_c0_g1_i9:146-1024(-)